MARLLIMNRDNLRRNHPNPDSAYRPGDIVAVLPDGHIPGLKEKEPDFIWVDYPGVSESRFKRFLEPEWSQEQETEWNDLQRGPEGDSEVRQALQRRLYRFTREELTQEEEAATKTRSPEHLIVDDSSGDITKQRFDGLLKNKRTEETIEEEGRPIREPVGEIEIVRRQP